MKRTFLCRSLVFVPAVALLAGILFPAEQTLALQDRYYGSVEYGAFDKVPDSCVITVPKKQLKGYKKIFKAAGLSSKVKIK